MTAMIVPQNNSSGSKFRLPPIHNPKDIQKLTPASSQEENKAASKKIRLVAIQPMKNDETQWHRGKTNQPAGLSSGAKDGFNVRTEKFATHWAKARADNADMFSRTSEREKDSSKNQQTDVELPKIHETGASSRNGKSASSVGKGNSNPSSLVGRAQSRGLKERRGSDRIPPNNTWAQVIKRRKALRERAAHSSTKRPDAHANADSNANEITNHQPYTNDLKKVTKLYTAMTVGTRHHSGRVNGHRELARAQSNPESLNYDKTSAEVILSRREAQAYLRINKVYDNNDDALKRQNRFYQKLEDVQEKAAKLQNIELEKKKRENDEARKRHQRQLQEVRKRYFAEKMRRFSHQYVSSKVFENEEYDRHIYGLPDEYRESASREESKKKAKKQPQRNPEETKKRNKKKFDHLFAVHFVSTLKSSAKRRPLMEGIDTVVIEEQSEGSSIKGRKYSVQDIIKDAQQCLKQPSQTDLIERRSDSSLDLEEEDLFEKARKKYGVNVTDSDDEEVELDRKSL